MFRRQRVWLPGAFGFLIVEGWQDRKITLPSMIAVVRGPLAYGEVFPDGASLTSVWLA
jgi:hypothetical protein